MMLLGWSLSQWEIAAERNVRLSKNPSPLNNLQEFMDLQDWWKSHFLNDPEEIVLLNVDHYQRAYGIGPKFMRAVGQVYGQS